MNKGTGKTCVHTMFGVQVDLMAGVGIADGAQESINAGHIVMSGSTWNRLCEAVFARRPVTVERAAEIKGNE